mmetsp:Transcript_48744/g.157504  ORF Transcript_48744/g.157504 Transcript_48744/m.157504 type:complete len:122 (-) Transcript_48744:172-537(-)
MTRSAGSPPPLSCLVARSEFRGEEETRHAASVLRGQARASPPVVAAALHLRAQHGCYVSLELRVLGRVLLPPAAPLLSLLALDAAGEAARKRLVRAPARRLARRPPTKAAVHAVERGGKDS